MRKPFIAIKPLSKMLSVFMYVFINVITIITTDIFRFGTTTITSHQIITFTTTTNTSLSQRMSGKQNRIVLQAQFIRKKIDTSAVSQEYSYENETIRFAAAFYHRTSKLFYMQHSEDNVTFRPKPDLYTAGINSSKINLYQIVVLHKYHSPATNHSRSENSFGFGNMRSDHFIMKTFPGKISREKII